MKDMVKKKEAASLSCPTSGHWKLPLGNHAHYDTIIIGAGMSGLAAGIRLAYYDQRVCILERHYTIGGLNSFYRLRGRDYDVGLHAVTTSPQGRAKGPLARLLRQLRFAGDSASPQLGSAAFPASRSTSRTTRSCWRRRLPGPFRGRRTTTPGC
jgi:choline dehydrogenase-like flavoprotein